MKRHVQEDETRDQLYAATTGIKWKADLDQSIAFEASDRGE